ncbi:MAG TPA: copper transporter [Ornithinicoccus sp.]|nr:copper transporter [Ornithinicoccus sp.]
MIDFRYHLVSLVAVFMALAVGIVLGAGPLGQEISSTLEAQVRDLREERNGLRDQLGQAEAREDLKDEVLELVTPTVTANQLTGRRVALVALPGADRNLIGELQDDIAVAGGEAVVTARLEDRWSDPESAENRHDLAAELAPELVLPTPRDGEEPTAETVLAAALTGQDASVGTGAWRNAMDRLSEEGFLDTTWTTGQDAVTGGAPDSVVIITGSLSTAQVEEAADGDTRLQQSLDIISAFGDLGVPTLVAGSGTESYSDPVQASESPVVRGVRAESAIAETVSSVDNIEGTAGQLAAVLALRWAIEGQPGHWGLGTDAVAPAPEVPAPMPEETLPTGPTAPPQTELPTADPTDGPGAGEPDDTEGPGESPTGDPTDPVPTTEPTTP